MSEKETMTENKDPTLWLIVWSVLCAFFGVSNKANYERDRVYLEKEGFKPYIIAAIILALVFVLSVSAVVTIVLNYAGV
jgi:hypothetical protein